MANKILCYLLMATLVWLPMSLSAEVMLASFSDSGCHDLNPVTAVSVNHQSKHIVNAQEKLMSHKGCCDHCDNNCSNCTGMSSCGHGSNHVSAFIVYSPYLIQSRYLSVSSSEYAIQYLNQIIIPDIRPPVV